MAGLIRDLNSNITDGHSATAIRKGGLTFSGRKPLVELSNSGKTFLKAAAETMVAKKKNFAAKASETGTRKALSDISNSNRNQTSKKKQNTKLTAVTEEPFLHNHQECIKSQHHAVDMDQFLKTVGLANGFPKELPSLKRPESPLRFHLLEEMPEEQPISDGSANKFDNSPPKSPDHYQIWKGRNDCISFNLLDTPKLVKH